MTWTVSDFLRALLFVLGIAAVLAGVGGLGS